MHWSACFLAVLLGIALSASVVRADSPTPSFTSEIVPLLTKSGCNQGTCHGKGTGQNGFRLSLRGFAPDKDYDWMTREFGGRRLDPNRPEESLLLRKASGQTPHEGGRLLAPGSREYALLRSWIAAGFPGPKPSDVKIGKLELTPAAAVLKPGEEVALTATATFTDGTKRNVTWLTRFDSNDPAYLQVSPSGKVRALRNGATAVRAMFLTEVAVAVFSMPHDRPVDAAQL